MRRARAHIATVAACALLFLVTPKTPLLVWNATASAPTGLYRVVSATPIRRGDLVLALPPRSVRQFASVRGYLPDGVPLIKHIAALGGDRVCNEWHTVTINDKTAAIRLDYDSVHRWLPQWSECRTLTKSEVLLLNPDVTHSFDGRYFGPVSTTSILGKLVPIWTH